MVYRIAVGNGWVSPSEFWQMPPGEIWWLLDAKTPPEKRDKPNAMRELYDMLKAHQARKAAKKHG